MSLLSFNLSRYRVLQQVLYGSQFSRIINWTSFRHFLVQLDFLPKVGRSALCRTCWDTLYRNTWVNIILQPVWQCSQFYATILRDRKIASTFENFVCMWCLSKVGWIPKKLRVGCCCCGHHFFEKKVPGSNLGFLIGVWMVNLIGLHHYWLQYWGFQLSIGQQWWPSIRLL